jgi:hypothetical protein
MEAGKGFRNGILKLSKPAAAERSGGFTDFRLGSGFRETPQGRASKGKKGGAKARKGGGRGKKRR